MTCLIFDKSKGEIEKKTSKTVVSKKTTVIIQFVFYLAVLCTPHFKTECRCCDLVKRPQDNHGNAISHLISWA